MRLDPGISGLHGIGVCVSVGKGVCVAVGSGVGVWVGRGVGVLVGTGVWVAVGDDVAVGVNVGEGVNVGRGVGVSVVMGVCVDVLVGIVVFVGTIAAAIGVLGGMGVNDAATVGVAMLVGVGELVGISAIAGAAGSGVGEQVASQPKLQRKEGPDVPGGATDCQYQSAIAPPAREIVAVPPMKARNDARSSFSMVRLLCREFIQAGGLRIPFAASILMNWLSRSIIATPTKSISNEQIKKKGPLDCQTATVHITATPPIFHSCPGGLNMKPRIESTVSCIIDSMVGIQPLLPAGVCLRLWLRRRLRLLRLWRRRLRLSLWWRLWLSLRLPCLGRRWNEYLRSRMGRERIYTHSNLSHAPCTVWLIVEVPVVRISSALSESAHRFIQRVNPVSGRGARLRVRMTVVEAFAKERSYVLVQRIPLYGTRNGAQRNLSARAVQKVAAGDASLHLRLLA